MWVGKDLGHRCGEWWKWARDRLKSSCALLGIVQGVIFLWKTPLEGIGSEVQMLFGTGLVVQSLAGKDLRDALFLTRDSRVLDCLAAAM